MNISKVKTFLVAAIDNLEPVFTPHLRDKYALLSNILIYHRWSLFEIPCVHLRASSTYLLEDTIVFVKQPNVPVLQQVLSGEYRVTEQFVQNLLLTSKHKFSLGLARTSQAKMELLFRSQRDVLHKLLCHTVDVFK